MTDLVEVPQGTKEDLAQQRQDADLLLAYLANNPIEDDATLQKFGDQLKETVGHKKRIDGLRKTITKPLLDAKRAADALFMPTVKLLGEVEKAIKKSVAVYHLGQAQREAEARKALVAAEDAAEHREAVVALAQAVATPATDGISTRKKTVLKIDDVSAIPRGYLVPDEAAILAALKAGGTVPGCRLDEELTIAVRA